jgi:hypothetical protein
MQDEPTPQAIIITLLAACLTAAAGALGEISDAAKDVMRAVHMNVMDDASLRLVCIMGSIGGALISVLLYPLPRTKELIAKLVVSVIAGVMFTPMVVRWLNLSRDTDTLLFASCAVALLGYTSLQIIVPLAHKWVGGWLGVKLGGSPYDLSDGRPRARRHDLDKTQKLEP